MLKQEKQEDSRQQTLNILGAVMHEKSQSKEGYENFQKENLQNSGILMADQSLAKLIKRNWQQTFLTNTTRTLHFF